MRVAVSWGKHSVMKQAADDLALLVRIVGPQLGQWGLADELHREWVRVRPDDTRASAFAPTIASRLAAERQT